MNLTGYQSLFNEQNQTVDNLVINGTVDFSNATIIGFPVDNVTVDFNGNDKLEVKDNGISTQKIQDNAVTDAKIFSMDAKKLFGTVTVDVNNVNTTTQNLTLTNKLTLPDGTQADPSLTFTNDQDTGLFRSASDTISFTTNGNRRLDINTSKILSSLQFQGPFGSASNPTYSFSVFPNDGMYRSPTGISLSLSSADLIQFLNFGTFMTTPLYQLVGSAASPGYSFTSDQDTGMYSFSSDTIGFSCGGNIKLTVGATTSSLSTPLVMGTHPLSCGSITASGTISNGTNSLTTGNITSGSINCGTNSVTCGSINSASINMGTNSLICGAITSSGTFSNGTNSLTTGAITSSGNFTNGGNSMTTGILTVNTLRGSGTADTLFIDRSTVITSGNRYYSVNVYYDSSIANWRYVGASNYGQAITGQGAGSLNFLISNSASTASNSAVGSMSTRLSIDPINGIQPRMPIVSTESAQFSSVLSNGTISCGTNSLTCGNITSRAINAGTYSLTCGSITSSGTFSNGTNSMTTGAITSSGNFNNGTNSITTGSITASGRIVCQQGRPLCVLASYGLGSAIQNTTTEINIMGTAIGGTLAANSVIVGSVIRIQCYALVSVLALNNLRLRVYMGSNVIADTGNFGPGLNVAGDMLFIECNGNIRSTGGSGTLMMAGKVSNLNSAILANFNPSFTIGNINTTISNLISMTIQFSAADPSNSFESQIYEIYTS